MIPTKGMLVMLLLREHPPDFTFAFRVEVRFQAMTCLVGERDSMAKGGLDCATHQAHDQTLVPPHTAHGNSIFSHLTGFTLDQLS